MLNETAPNFRLKDQNGNEFELYNNLDQKVLLVFYPKDNSPVCTKQLNNYNQNMSEFNELGIRVVGVNVENTKSQSTFCENLELNFILLSDVDKVVSKLYNAVNLFGINKRKIVLINTDKKIMFEKTVLPFYYLNSDKIIQEVKACKLDLLT
ncbi:redoxin domain-containing protein [bacterium BMS3Abin03]|nr:redoxin domain-containing protein [bacterium BMS3Abin03]